MNMCLAKAHEWFGQLASGRSPSIAAIAKTQQVTSSYVTRVVKMAFLPPDAVQSIARGEHPPHLSARRMLRTVPLSIDWAQQRLLPGFHR